MDARAHALTQWSCPQLTTPLCNLPKTRPEGLNRRALLQTQVWQPLRLPFCHFLAGTIVLLFEPRKEEEGRPAGMKRVGCFVPQKPEGRPKIPHSWPWKSIKDVAVQVTHTQRSLWNCTWPASNGSLEAFSSIQTVSTTRPTEVLFSTGVGKPRSRGHTGPWGPPASADLCALF